MSKTLPSMSVYLYDFFLDTIPKKDILFSLFLFTQNLWTGSSRYSQNGVWVPLGVLRGIAGEPPNVIYYTSTHLQKKEFGINLLCFRLNIHF